MDLKAKGEVERFQEDVEEIVDSIDPMSRNSRRCKSCYDSTQRGAVSVIYVALVFIWIVLFYYLDFFDGSLIMSILFLLPLVILFIDFCSLGTVTKSVEKEVFKSTIITAGILISLPLIGFLDKSYTDKPQRFFRIFAVAVIFVIVAMIPIWVPDYYLPIIRHLRTGFQTEALGLLVIALYIMATDFKHSK